MSAYGFRDCRPSLSCDSRSATILPRYSKFHISFFMTSVSMDILSSFELLHLSAQWQCQALVEPVYLPNLDVIKTSKARGGTHTDTLHLLTSSLYPIYVATNQAIAPYGIKLLCCTGNNCTSWDSIADSVLVSTRRVLPVARSRPPPRLWVRALDVGMAFSATYPEYIIPSIEYSSLLVAQAYKVGPY